MAKRLETESNATNFSWPHFAARRALRKWWNKEIREPLFWRPSSDAIIIGAHPRSSSSLWWSGAVSRACFRCYCSLFFSSTLFRFFCFFIVFFFLAGRVHLHPGARWSRSVREKSAPRKSRSRAGRKRSWSRSGISDLSSDKVAGNIVFVCGLGDALFEAHRQDLSRWKVAG